MTKFAGFPNSDQPGHFSGLWGQGKQKIQGTRLLSFDGKFVRVWELPR